MVEGTVTLYDLGGGSVEPPHPESVVSASGEAIASTKSAVQRRQEESFVMESKKRQQNQAPPLSYRSC